jgi:hypothetical protein
VSADEDLPAVFRATSCNAKLSPVDYVKHPGSVLPQPVPRHPFTSSTFAAIGPTCPDSCPFKRDGNKSRGCYADSGITGMTARQLERAARGMSSLEVVQCEAALIDAAFPRGVPQDGAHGGRDLRLHVGGDVRTAEEAALLAGAAERWRARGGGSVWTYTHAWREIPRAAWGSISVLASVEDEEDAQRARERGYAPALVVVQHRGDRARRSGELRIVPCPAETRQGTTCADCRLCLDRDLHALGIAISFAIHGPTRAAHHTLVAVALSRGKLTPPKPPKRKYRGRERPRCECCSRITFAVNGPTGRCSDCVRCRLEGGSWVADWMCPREQAKKLRPVIAEQVEAAREEPRRVAAASKVAAQLTFRPKYEPF